jgi:hypothetical protein
VLLLQWQGKAVDDRTENLEKLSNTVEPLGLVDELEEDVVDGTTNVGSQVEEFAVYAMESGLEEVTLSWIFRVEQLEKLGYVSIHCQGRYKCSLLTLSTKLWSMYAFAMFVLKS